MVGVQKTKILRALLLGRLIILAKNHLLLVIIEGFRNVAFIELQTLL